ncbi:hypothetical protein GCM10012275_60410 [Longimycelium tulufanense]|uniref:DUF3558 domain-containing protein n=1 Tax=Longimycelium tulufanense TaxID=907463 RepID=A0A8J3FZ56_9PSEU|nr:DUF3558 domain-containing protein [Longimycelium tulufanense]GGM81680.1 hypothetical protein GCM10012275_60410 [Longimycelium tulufanense]
MRRLLIVPLVCAAALVVASCGGANPGSPAATDHPTTTSSVTSPTPRLAPPLTQPELNTESFERDPCALLRPDQVSQFGEHKPPKREDGITGPGCTWDPESSLKTGVPGTSVSVTINTKSGGLEGIYQRRAKFGYFQKTEVAGYPGVHALDDKSGPAEGTCASLIGIAEDRLVVVDVFIGDRKNPQYTSACTVGDRAAGMVIENIKGAK